MARSWMLAHLAQQTQPLHAAADGDRLAILEKPTVERYRSYLAQIYCFEAPLEAACISSKGIPRNILRTHLKTWRLAADLDVLGFAARPAMPLETPRFESPVEALAWLWVLHRNTLLHGLIHRYLLSKMREPAHAARSYLCAFEGRAGALMRELGSTLDDVTRRASLAERAVAAAREALRLQHQWYSCSQISPRGPQLPRTITPRAA